jgi:hypothetical protein
VLPESGDSMKTVQAQDRMKKVFFWIMRFTVSFGILYYLLKLIPMEKVLETIRSANILLVVIAILLTQLLTYISAMKSKILTDEHNMSLTVGKIFKINYVTQFYGLFLPEVISSGLIRWHKFSTPDRKPAEALASMIFCRFIEITLLLVLGLMFWILDKSSRSNDFLGIILAILLLVCIVIYYVAFSRKISLLILNILNKISFLPKIFVEKIQKVLMATSKYQSLKKSSLFKVIGLNIIKDMISIFSFYLLAISVNINVKFVSIAWIRSYVQIFCLLPISISGIGIQEGSLIYFLGSFGTSTSSAVALSLLFYLRTLIGGAIGGLIQVAELVTSSQKKTEMSKVV